MLECTLALHGSLAQQSGHVVLIDVAIVYIESIFSGPFSNQKERATCAPRPLSSIYCCVALDRFLRAPIVVR
jgi:hypothetical protein